MTDGSTFLSEQQYHANEKKKSRKSGYLVANKLVGRKRAKKLQKTVYTGKRLEKIY